MAKIDCSIVKTLTDLELTPCYPKELPNDGSHSHVHDNNYVGEMCEAS